MSQKIKHDFFNEIYWDNNQRIIKKRDLEADIKQWDLNQSLSSEEGVLQKKYQGINNEIYFIVGLPRSGTTLLSQLLINTFDFGYFYNKIAKYYSAPLFGYSKIKPRDIKSLNLDSALGITLGDFAPHEFSYFWQNWLKFKGHDEPSIDLLDQVNWSTLSDKLHAISNIQSQNLLVKSVTYTNFIIEHLSEKIPNAKFILIERDPFFVVQSILESRVKQYGSEDTWWSLRPKEYKKWENLSPVKQVANQVIYSSAKIDQQLNAIDPSKVFRICYEELVKDMELILGSLSEKFGLNRKEYSQVHDVKFGNSIRVEANKALEISRELNRSNQEFLL